MNTLSAAGDVGLILGGISFNRTVTNNLQIGNSSSSVNGILQLNGATIDTVANTLISVAGSSNLTIANVNSGSGTQAMGFVSEPLMEFSLWLQGERLPFLPLFQGQPPQPASRRLALERLCFPEQIRSQPDKHFRRCRQHCFNYFGVRRSSGDRSGESRHA